MPSGADAERCPWCGAPRGVAREYCLECGSRLVQGAPPPIHWLWPALAALLVAAGGGAIAAASHGKSASVRTFVATQRLVTVPAPVAQPTATTGTPPSREQTTGSTQKLGGRLIPWAGSGYTIILAAIPTSSGVGAAKQKALAALADGLQEVGVLVSSSYPGLHPGYFMVFSGVYGTLDEAQSALPTARSDFPGAYARLVARS